MLKKYQHILKKTIKKKKKRRDNENKGWALSKSVTEVDTRKKGNGNSVNGKYKKKVYRKCPHPRVWETANQVSLLFIAFITNYRILTI